MGLVPLLTSASLFAQDEAAPTASKQQNLVQTLLMIGIALVFFYFILWRPEQKRRKKMETQRKSLQKEDHVTAMGIVGTVSSIKEKTVILKMVDGTKIEVLKHAITEVNPAITPEENPETT